MVVISNGFNKFHMAVAAAEAQRRNILSSFITGAYPTPIIRWVSSIMGLGRNRKFARLLTRAEAINDGRIEPAWRSESLYEFAKIVRRAAPGFAAMLEARSLQIYGRQAIRLVIEAAHRGARIYHYRAGFGGVSVKVAASRGMVTICDYSLAHAAKLPQLLTDGGSRVDESATPQFNRVWPKFVADAERADCVLVNSDFVKGTFLEQGWDPARVRVIYLGVDDAFIDCVPLQTATFGVSGPLRLLFAGGFELRKGADRVITALKLLSGVPWTLEIAGVVAPEIRRCGDFLKDPRVSVSGWLARDKLAARMAAAEVFVFPSRAEGSARVVFEALAAGCYVITTPNAGSIVEDGVHGRLISLDDPNQIAVAIRDAAAKRLQLAEIGRRNAALVREKYRQRDYGDKLAALYENLLIAKRPREAA